MSGSFLIFGWQIYDLSAITERMDHSNNYIVDVNNPIEDPFVYYTDELGRQLKCRINLVKPGLWGRRGKMILFLDSLKSWESEAGDLTTNEYVTALKRIVKDLNNHDLTVELQ